MNQALAASFASSVYIIPTFNCNLLAFIFDLYWNPLQRIMLWLVYLQSPSHHIYFSAILRSSTIHITRFTFPTECRYCFFVDFNKLICNFPSSSLTPGFLSIQMTSSSDFTKLSFYSSAKCVQ